MVLNQADNVIFEGSEVSKIMLGDTLIWPQAQGDQILKAKTIIIDGAHLSRPPQTGVNFPPMVTSDNAAVLPIFLELGSGAGEVSASHSNSLYTLTKINNNLFILETTRAEDYSILNSNGAKDTIVFTCSGNPSESHSVNITCDIQNEYNVASFGQRIGGRTDVVVLDADNTDQYNFGFYTKCDYGIITDTSNPKNLNGYIKGTDGVKVIDSTMSFVISNSDVTEQTFDDEILVQESGDSGIERDGNAINIELHCTENNTGSWRYQLFALINSGDSRRTSYCLFVQPPKSE